VSFERWLASHAGYDRADILKARRVLNGERAKAGADGYTDFTLNLAFAAYRRGVEVERTRCRQDAVRELRIKSAVDQK
jgi:hypothetical protein